MEIEFLTEEEKDLIRAHRLKRQERGDGLYDFDAHLDKWRDDDEATNNDEDDAALADEKAQRVQKEQDRKERRERAIERDRIEMEFLRKRNEDLEKRMLEQEFRSHRQDHYSVEQKIEEAERECRLAEEVMAKAIAEANGDDAAKALRFRDEALEKIRELSAKRKHLKEQTIKYQKEDLEVDELQLREVVDLILKEIRTLKREKGLSLEDFNRRIEGPMRQSVFV